uniref:Kazal-like domain-containing protein n=1 Tax=Leersia perrieri TaxID=77586 RepID=A0A0D9V6Z5_9ORYZ
MPVSYARTARLRLLVLFLASLSLLFAQTLASASETGQLSESDPCAASAAVSDGGSDSTPSSCPVRCFRPDPVCGADGVTYWCGCPEAACAGARVARRGYCEVGAGSAPVSGQALLLVHIVWLFVLGAAVLFGFL